MSVNRYDIPLPRIEGAQSEIVVTAWRDQGGRHQHDEDAEYDDEYNLPPLSRPITHQSPAPHYGTKI